jgi:peptidoglycan/LPS O-acetylase OafA/YrhL
VSLRAAEPWAWAYVMNFFVGMTSVHTYIDHFWSLAVEEHFYLVWPLVVWAFRRRLDGLLATCVVVVVLSRGARFACELGGMNEFATSWFTPFRLDALCFGAGIAVCMRRPGGPSLLARAVPLLALIGAALFVAQAALRYLPAQPSALAQPADSFGLVLMFGALVIRATQGSGRLLQGLLLNRPMLLLGKYSYGVYVFHALIARYLWIRQPDTWLAARIGSPVAAFLLQAAIATAVSIGVAVLSYELYERRFLALKERFSPHVAP